MMLCKNHPSVSEGVVRCWRCMKPVCANCRVNLSGKTYCAECKVEAVADMRSGVTAEAMELAGIGRRFVAVFIDGIILFLPIWIIIMVMAFGAVSSGSEEMPGYFNFLGLFYLPVYIVYEGLMLGSRGQTVGKIAMKVKVVRPTGEDISAGQAWGRTIVRNLFISLLALINYLPALFTKEKTAVHDMAAKTRVIRVQ